MLTCLNPPMASHNTPKSWLWLTRPYTTCHTFHCYNLISCYSSTCLLCSSNTRVLAAPWTSRCMLISLPTYCPLCLEHSLPDIHMAYFLLSWPSLMTPYKNTETIPSPSKCWHSISYIFFPWYLSPAGIYAHSDISLSLHHNANSRGNKLCFVHFCKTVPGIY